jgi:hypothetical protein
VREHDSTFWGQCLGVGRGRSTLRVQQRAEVVDWAELADMRSTAPVGHMGHGPAPLQLPAACTGGLAFYVRAVENELRANKESP